MRLAAVLLLVAGLALAGPAPAGEPALSILALGDTGKPTSWPERWMPQYRVGAAMEREDRRSPVEALLFLGDNFYPKGLSRRTLRRRMRENLAGPYCYFLMLTRKGRRAVREVCDLPPDETHPIPIIAVTGNHDLERRQGVSLQRERLPVFLANWLMPREARAYELGAGVSVIAFHSQPILEGLPATALTQALLDSEGPWRIVIAHHPIADPGAGWSAAYADRVLAAIEAAGKPVHLFLAGHQHSLQALRGPGAALHVVAGAGGAQIRHVSPTRTERLFAETAYGFVRIDRVDGADRAAGSGSSPGSDAFGVLPGSDAFGVLDVTLFGLSGPFDRHAEPRARYRLTQDGAVEALDEDG